MSPDSSEFTGADRFRAERRLGEGAFGIVYQAYDLKRDSWVALKTLRAVYADSLYRFKQEFRSLADVQHPNLVKLHELLSDGERWFFTMELVDGVNFLSYIRGLSPSASFDDAPTQVIEMDPSPAVATERIPCEPAFDAARLRSALKQLAEGLNALHNAGKLHRDIKPSNVLVTTSGRVVLLDFGMVKELAPDAPERGRALVGTPGYMSPEQAAEGDINEASDWYSVGVMLYEAMTGRLPFSGSTFDMLARKKSLDPQPPIELAPHIPADLNALCMELLSRRPDARPTGDEVLRRVDGSVQSTTAKLRSGESQRRVFVGRAVHLGFLNDAFRASRAGRAVTVFVHGSSGAGKTTLVRHFLDELRRADPGAVVLAGRCFERESVPYKGLDSLMDALSRFLQDLREAEQEALMPRGVPALARLFPVLRQSSAVARARTRILEIPDSLELRNRAFAALRELLVRLAARLPVVLFIDDLQWSDLDSAMLIEEVMRPPDPPELLLIVAYRTEEAETSLSLKTLLESRRRAVGQDVRELSVAELPQDEACALVRELSGGAEELSPQAETIAREAGGNPFFVHQLVRFREAELRTREPGAFRQVVRTTLDDVIRARLEQISPSARILAQVLAAAGRPVDHDVLMHASAVENHADALDLLRAEHLVRARSAFETEQFELYHARIGQSILAGTSMPELRVRHAALAAALEKSGRADPETLFFHFSEAGDEATAAGYAAAAAAQAWNALAFDRAARLYRNAIELHAPGESALRLRLADSLANAGRADQAARTYLEAAEEAPPVQRIELQRRASEQLLRSGQIDAGLSILRSVLHFLKMSLPETPRGALLSLISRRLYLKLRGLRFRQREAASIDALELLRIDTCRSVALGLGILDHIRGADFQARHLILALRAGEPSRVARALAFEVGFSANGGGRKRERTERLKRRAMELIENLGDPYAVGEMALTSGLAAYLLGEWPAAVGYFQEAEKILLERCTGVARELVSARTFLLRSYTWLGELDTLSRRLPELLKDARERGDLYAELLLMVRNSFLPHLAADNPAAAHEEARVAIGRWPQAGFHTLHYIYLCVATEIDLYSGNSASAWKRVMDAWGPLRRSLLMRVQFVRIEFPYLRAKCALAVARAGASRTEDHLRSAERDAKTIERESMPWGDPLAKAIRAGLAFQRGDLDAAAELLALAEAGFDSSRMALYAAAVRRRRGQLIGGEEGHALLTAAEEWMAGQKITRFAPMTDMLIP
ncbi:MAG: protein kinase [Bryobacteraceae bacterium]